MLQAGIIFFNLPNPSSRIIFYSVSNKNEYQKVFLEVKLRLARKADKITAV
jgi:hypothetical protein